MAGMVLALVTLMQWAVAVASLVYKGLAAAAARDMTHMLHAEKQ
jgi:hypothetical protein